MRELSFRLNDAVRVRFAHVIDARFSDGVPVVGEASRQERV
jgi:hypothetical protein